ncbi:MAG: RloB family protein [Terracidiphilus sp.]|nr:RloB family protein [Terracidiphilus sp.]
MTSRFRRLQGLRRYKRMFVIVAEGTVTEQEYFPLLDEDLIVHIKCLKHRNNLSPKEALQRVREYVKKEGLKKTDQAWGVVDKDSWPEEHLVELHGWAQSRSNYGFALSNPKFEYWLLLHFEDANGVTTSDDCNLRLKKHLPDYNKHVESQHFSIEKIQTAVARARKRDNPPCVDWPRTSGTTVYRLVTKILESGDQSPTHPQSRR